MRGEAVRQSNLCCGPMTSSSFERWNSDSPIYIPVSGPMTSSSFERWNSEDHPPPSIKTMENKKMLTNVLSPTMAE